MDYLVVVKAIGWMVVAYSVARASAKIYPFNPTEVMEELYLDDEKKKLNEVRMMQVLNWDREAFNSLLLAVVVVLALYFLK